MNKNCNKNIISFNLIKAMKKIQLVILLFLVNIFLYGQTDTIPKNIFSFSSSFETVLMQNTTFGQNTIFGTKKTLRNEIESSYYHSLYDISNDLTLNLGLRVYGLNSNQYLEGGTLYYNEFNVAPVVCLKYKSISTSVGYYYAANYIGDPSNPNTFTANLLHISKKGYFVEVSALARIVKDQYVRFKFGFERLKATYREESNLQHNYTIGIQTVSAGLKLSEIKLLNTSDIQNTPYLFSLLSKTSFRNNDIDHIKYITSSQLYVARFLSDRFVLGSKLSYDEEMYEHQSLFDARYFALGIEFKYLFFKSFFTDISYEQSFNETNEKYLSNSISVGLGAYLKLTDRSVLETRLFYSYGTLFVEEYQPEFGNQINNHIGLNFRLHTLM